ncbi:MAG: hypothetical protein JWO80_2496 [Bryobacterales bacterium]|nr:hypothetical protein [Bryobacterales bacterium]
MLNDLLYAARSLRKSPVFAVTAIVTIALGIGASTAIFSVTDAVLLRPLPYKNPDRLVFACSDMTRRNVKDFPFSNADYFDLRAGTTAVFDDIGGVATGRGAIAREDGSLEPVSNAGVTTNFFRLMGAKIAMGRDFTDADGQPAPTPPPVAAGQTAPPAPAGPAVAILSYEFWQRRYAADTGILGRNLPNNGPQIVGVLAPRFELFFPPAANMESLPDIWFARRMAYDATQRNNVAIRIIGRLKDGVTLDRAQPAADLVSADIRRKNTISATAGQRIRLEPMQKYIVAEVRPAILALMGAVIFLLLIACANVANLILVRSSLRERELAVRTALGGSRWRLVRQMLAESVLLAGAGTVLGVALASFGIHQLLVIAPANLPRLDSIAIDPTVLAFSALTGLAAAAIFGAAPALRASRPNVMIALRASGRTAGLGGGRLLRNSVVIAEVALSFVLLIGSGLMFRSFLALQRIDPGFEAHNLLTFQILGGRTPVPEQRAAFMRQVHSRLAAIPGVQSVTAATPFPLAGGFSPIRWGREEALTDPSKFQATDFQFVLPGYFETMRMRLIAGRTFTEADNAPTRKVVVIDESLAAKAFPHESAVGKRILTRINTPEPEWVQVIGVVGHQRETSLAEVGREQLYFTDGFIGYGIAGRWAVRTPGDPAQYAPLVRSAIAALGNKLMMSEVQPMDVLVEKAQSSTRFSLLLIGVFAVIALLLAGVGLYGVLSTVVRQRTAEIGVRMALGAAPGRIFNLVVGHGLALSAAGIAVGLVAAFALTRVMTSMLVGVKPTDPTTFTVMAILFLVIAAVASWLPARRAAALDPNAALRDE